MTSEAQLLAAIGTLTAVVGWFGTRFWTDLQETKREVRQLRDEYGNLRQKYGELKGAVSGVATCSTAGCQWRQVFSGNTPPMGSARIQSDPANPSIFKTPRPIRNQ